jgi:hypothetical protein
VIRTSQRLHQAEENSAAPPTAGRSTANNAGLIRRRAIAPWRMIACAVSSQSRHRRRLRGHTGPSRGDRSDRARQLSMVSRLRTARHRASRPGRATKLPCPWSFRAARRECIVHTRDHASHHQLPQCSEIAISGAARPSPAVGSIMISASFDQMARSVECSAA